MNIASSFQYLYCRSVSIHVACELTLLINFYDCYVIQNDGVVSGNSDIGRQLDAENYYQIILAFFTHRLTSASSEVFYLKCIII